MNQNLVYRNLFQQRKELSFLKFGKEHFIPKGPMTGYIKIFDRVNEIARTNLDKNIKLLNMENNSKTNEFKVEVLIEEKTKKTCHLLTVKMTKAKSFLSEDVKIFKGRKKPSSSLNQSNLKTKAEYIEFKRNALIKVIGKEAFESLLDGGKLKIWRNTSPHNQWVESKSGKMLWHKPSESIVGVDLSSFELISESDKTVSYGNSLMRNFDEGMAEESTYVLKSTLRDL